MTVALPAEVSGRPTEAIDVAAVRADFPLLARSVNGKPLVYLDNAATAQKPAAVIDAVDHFLRHENANIHRGVHYLSAHATLAYDEVRTKVRHFINAREDREIVFVRGTTEAINLVAQSYGRPRLGPGDEILVSEMEHHSNLVPWQLLAEQVGATVVQIPHQLHRSPDRSDQGGGHFPRVQRVGHRQPRGRTLPGGARPRGRVRGGRRAGRAPSPSRRPGARLRLLRLLRSQDVRAHRCRGALRASRVARGHASLSRRRGNDRFGVLRRNHVRTHSDSLRGGHAGHC